MNCIRINTAYGTLDQYSKIVSHVRNFDDIPIILDLKGPEIRLKSGITSLVKKGEKKKIGRGHEIEFNHNIYKSLSLDDKILIDNGKIKTRIVKKEDESITLLFLNDARISDGKGVNIPNRNIKVETLSTYDFSTEIDVNILGHIFEHSINEIEEITAELEGKSTDKKQTKRKKEGIFYTPKYITQYIVENTVGSLCREKKEELKILDIGIDESHKKSDGKISKKGE